MSLGSAPTWPAPEGCALVGAVVGVGQGRRSRAYPQPTIALEIFGAPCSSLQAIRLDAELLDRCRRLWCAKAPLLRAPARSLRPKPGRLARCNATA